ncbi:MAG TPA: cellulase family glycosylhydrolase [Nitrososphaeraceae archaeon]
MSTTNNFRPLGEDIYLNNARLLFKQDKWFIDDKSRFVLFRGVNFASRSKFPPYLPIVPLNKNNISENELDEEIKKMDVDIDRLKHLGLNIVRLLILWKGLEPSPNPDIDKKLLPEGENYLNLMRKVIDALYSRNLFVILDFHQDIAHEIFGGDGFPDWALAIDDKDEIPQQPKTNNKIWAASYNLNKTVKNTLKSFWSNDLTNTRVGLKHFPVRSHLEKTIGLTAKFFRDSSKSLSDLNDERGHPAIIGIEPFNEPHPVGIDKVHFEADLLKQFYFNVLSEIRNYDNNLFLFMEPRVDWSVFSAEDINKSLSKSSSSRGFDLSRFDLRKFLKVGDMNFIRTPLDGDIDKRGLIDTPKDINSYLPLKSDLNESFRNRGVFAFHYYDVRALASSMLKIPKSIPQYKYDWPKVFRQLMEGATKRGLIPFITEFGGSHESEQIREYMNLLFIQIETNLLNSTYWNYDLYHTEQGKDNWNLEDFSLLGPNKRPRHIDVIARPYPMLSSAEPSFLSFDIDSKYAIIILDGKVVEAPTIIYVPFHLHYSPTFYVWATSNEIKWDKEEQLLIWHPSRERTKNQLIISIQPELNMKSMPVESKPLLEHTRFVNKFQ